MTLGVVAIGILSFLALNRPPPPGFTAPDAASARTSGPSGASATTAAPPVATASGETDGEALRVLAVGDVFTAAAPEGTGWPELVAADLEAAGRSVDVVVAAAEGSGYARASPNGGTFSDLAERAGGDFDLVVFFGSHHDIAAAADVAAAAEATFEAARAASPEAALVVLGPTWPTPDPPGYIVTNRDALAVAVVPSGAVYVDPLAANWFSGTAPGLVAPDGLRPTAEGHRRLADLIRPVVEAALPVAS